ncbi:hypothetical protein U3516DRAFT_783717 [Neocallimastix sp. 'constans']
MFMGTRQLQKSKSNRHKIRYYDDLRYYINICKNKIGLVNKAKINDKSDRDDPDTNNKEISDNNLNYHLFNYINIIIMKKKITVNHILEQYLQTSMIKIII